MSEKSERRQGIVSSRTNFTGCGGSGGKHDDIGGFPLDSGRRVKRYEKVRLWLGALHAAAVAAASGGDSGTFSADSCQCDDSQLCLYASTERSTYLRNTSTANQVTRESLSIAASSSSSPSQSTHSSLNRLIRNRRKLLNFSIPAHREENCSAMPQQVPAAAGHNWQRERHNSDHMLSSSEGPATEPAESEQLKERAKNSQGESKEPSQLRAQRSTASSATDNTQATKPLANFLSDKSTQPPDDASSSSDSCEVVERIENYHVRVLPAMCYLVWRPDMLRRECLIDKGQVAHLNVLHPRVLPMERLMTAVAARLDIEVPLLDRQRAGYDATNYTPKFEYLFRWHRPNGQRIQTSDHITSIQHPPNQTGHRESPILVFISGSPGWLAKAK